MNYNITSKNKTNLNHIYNLNIALIIILAGFFGCAPLPPAQPGGQPPASQPTPELTISPAERDSIVKVRLSFGYECWKNGDYVSALEHYNVVRHYDIEHKKNIYRVWADCFVRQGALDSALFAYEEGIKLFPDDENLRLSLAIMYRNQGRFADAIVQQKEALRIKPDDARYLTDLEALYEAAEDWANAIATLETLVKLQPNDKDLRQRLIDLKRARQSPEEYLSELRKTVEQFPEDWSARFNYATVLLERKDSREAAIQFDIYTKNRPEDVEGWRRLAQALDNLAEWNGAIAALKKVVELQPKSAPDITAVSSNYLNLGQSGEARRWGARAIEAEAGYGPAYIVMADVYFKCADATAKDNPRYIDKLVFAIAYGLYEKAAASSEPQARSDGERGMRILIQSELVPSKEDKFMNSRTTRPTGKAYEWIDTNWPEVQYIDKYLNKLN
ncbi:MAG: tetratricopeptide repeat protein [Calditrichaeota bacterium]|nr:tetratricopeptide repeat protein [Calditrichota bacterium]